MTELFAQPKNAALEGFSFDSVESFAEQAEDLRGRCGNLVEELYITFRHGDGIDAALFDAIDMREILIPLYFEAVSRWSDDEKIRAIIAVRECGYTFEQDSIPDDFDILAYRVNSMKDLAWHLAKQGRFGELPVRMELYLNFDAIARDLSRDYRETDIAGRHYIYRCG